MKKIILYLLLFTNICLGQVTDTFNYTGFLTNNGWIAHGGTQVVPVTTPITYIKQITTTPGTLNYSNICTQGNKTRIIAGNTEDINLASPTDLTGTVYYSLIINVTSTTELSTNTTNTPNNTNFIHLCDRKGTGTFMTNFQARLCIRKGTSANTFNLAIASEGGSAYLIPTWSNDYVIGTYLIVVKYTFDTTSTMASLWVNTTIENTPLLTNNNLGTTRPAKIQSICIRQAGSTTLGTGNIEIDEIRLGSTWEYVTNQTTWNGSTWSNGSPNQYKKVVIDGNYNTSNPLPQGSFDACSVIVNVGPNKNLTINSDQYIKVQNEITNNGTIIVEDDGSIVQVNDNVSNTGNITYNRTVSSLNGYDYIYWSSPTKSSPLLQTLSSLYNTPSPGFQYQWNPTATNTNSTFGNWEGASSMTPGRGYIMRASSSYGWTGTLTSKFVGIPNNGAITYNVTGIDSTNPNYRFNLIGNPYPSSIDANIFLFTNTNIDGYVALWTHLSNPLISGASSPFYQTFQYNYANDYMLYNKTGSSIGPGTLKIASGQGFFVNLLPTTTPTNTIFSSSVTFNNSMRSETFSNSQFYRNSQQNKEGRIWLDLLDSTNSATRILVGYVDDATDDKDRLYDAITSQDFYTLINNEKFIIQGKDKFKKNDKVKIGVNITTVGQYKIAIAEVDGLFDNQDIYLEDKLLNITHDLKLSPYTFTSNIGTFNDRFIIKYKTNNGNNSNKMKGNLSLYNQNNNFNLDSDKIIKNVRVYDITGKLLYDNNFNSNNVSFNLECSKQILLVKIKTDDDEIVTKKISN